MKVKASNTVPYSEIPIRGKFKVRGHEYVRVSTADSVKLTDGSFEQFADAAEVQQVNELQLQLTMTENEAQVILKILDFVGGEPEGPRGVADALRRGIAQGLGVSLTRRQQNLHIGTGLKFPSRELWAEVSKP